MRYFQDIATGKTFAFGDDVVARETAGVWSFKTASGAALKMPATLQPCSAPPPDAVPSSLAIAATLALVASDTTMHRIGEAVALGLNTWTSADVVAWANWRRALRAIANGANTTATALPTRPPYPIGT